MDDVLLGIVLQRLDTVPLSAEASDLLLAALQGDEQLSAQLSADHAERNLSAEFSGPPATPVGAYMRSLTVSGFRGIGPPTILEVAPGPGLTLVVGRNGSGKSSFAEAIEVLLTGTLMRWLPPAPAVVRDGWRNKHASAAAEIKAEFLIEGSGQAVVARTWPAGADLGHSVEWLQRHGDKRAPIEALGWTDALREYRPFLSHSELEAFFGRPSELHDLLASVLGLDELTAASDRLNAARKKREDAFAVIKQRLESLRGRLGELDDERAGACLTALAGRNWDIETAKSAATGTEVPDGGQLEVLRRLAQLSAPPEREVSGATAALRVAADGLENVAGTAAGEALSLARLLEAALDHQRGHVEGDCPVCGRPDALTPRWRDATEEHLSRLRKEAATAEAATTEAAGAATQARALLQGPPKVDGLARVLQRVAAERQVIVFTHDNRLAAAVKDLNIPANVLEVTRRPKSMVEVRHCLGPVEQALKDAGALNADQALPTAVAMRVIPGLCRTAVEAALTQAIWRQQLRAGRTRDEIESSLTEARRRLTSLAALAMFSDTNQGAKVLPKLSGLDRAFASTFQALNRGAHQQYAGDLVRQPHLAL